MAADEGSSSTGKGPMDCSCAWGPHFRAAPQTPYPPPRCLHAKAIERVSAACFRKQPPSYSHLPSFRKNTDTHNTHKPAHTQTHTHTHRYPQAVYLWVNVNPFESKMHCNTLWEQQSALGCSESALVCREVADTHM